MTRAEKLSSWRWTIIDSFVRELTDLATGLRRGESVPSTGVDALRALQMAHAVYQSSREGVEVALPGDDSDPHVSRDRQ